MDSEKQEMLKRSLKPSSADILNVTSHLKLVENRRTIQKPALCPQPCFAREGWGGLPNHREAHWANPAQGRVAMSPVEPIPARASFVPWVFSSRLRQSGLGKVLLAPPCASGAPGTDLGLKAPNGKTASEINPMGQSPRAKHAGGP